MRHIKNLFFMFGITLAVGQNANALTAATTMPVRATVAAVCSVAALPVVFPVYDSAANLNATGTINVSCSSDAPYTVALGQGQNFLATSGRRMLGPTSTALLSYRLYSDSGQATLWGTGGGSILGNTVSGTGTGAEQTLTVYGLIPSGQTVPAGAYNDLVSVDVVY